MKVLVVGRGGREHAIAYALNQSHLQPIVYVAPGNAGMTFANCVNIDENEIEKLLDFALKEKIDLTIVGPENTLNEGIADLFMENNLLIFAPTKKASQIESSKEFAKKLMDKYGIPTAKYQSFDHFEKAYEYIKNNSFPAVIKYNGLASGKGVVIASNLEEAEKALTEMLLNKVYGESNIIIEEFLEGIEFSFMCLTHNQKIYPLEIAQDYKKVYDHDLGPNTGGMGAYSPVSLIDDEVVKDAFQNILVKTVEAMAQEGAAFSGCLYGGLMLTKSGVKVIEFNARFGDPETEVVLPRLESDLLEVILDLLNNKELNLKWRKEACLGVVMAANGYPKEYSKNDILENSIQEGIYHMGTKNENNLILSNGGRVLMVTSLGQNLKEAKENAYQKIKTIQHKNLFYRHDIGNKAIK